MSRLRIFIVWLLALAIAALSTQCSSGPPSGGLPSPNQMPPGEVTGTVGLQLTNASGLRFNSVQYKLLESTGTVEKSGTIDVSQSSTISTIIGGVRPGQGLTVELDAASTDGAVKCTGTSSPLPAVSR